MLINNITSAPSCGDTLPGCSISQCNLTAIHRWRPSRSDLLKLIENDPRHARRPISICQSNCSHCYAGHCGTSVS